MHVDHFSFETGRFAAGLARARRQLSAFCALCLLGGSVLSSPAAAQRLDQLDLSPLGAVARPRVIVADDSFAYSHSPATGSAAWVGEFMTREMLAREPAERTGVFYADRSVPAELRAVLRDYEGGALDRGHLAPDGDVPEAQAKILRMALSNVVPQSPGLNRGLWRRIEEHVRELAREQGAVFVVTAPVYLKQGAVRTAGSVLVPSHLAKCVLVYQVDEAKRNGGRVVPLGIERVAEPVAMEAWLVPNKNPAEGTTLDTYRSTVDECERLLELDLFPHLEDETETRLEAAR